METDPSTELLEEFRAAEEELGLTPDLLEEMVGCMSVHITTHFERVAMDYLLITDGVITNIIVCADDQTAAQFGAVPWYEGARIGDAYSPPPEPEPEPTETDLLKQQIADLQNQILTMRLGG